MERVDEMFWLLGNVYKWGALPFVRIEPSSGVIQDTALTDVHSIS